MIIIPARLESTRFPEKILAQINGKPMFIKTALQVKNVDKVCIATDSQKVVDIAKKEGFLAVLTSKEHTSGTERINEASKILGLKENEIIINVQADEPFIEPEIVEKLKKISEKKIKNNEAFMTSCYKKISQEDAQDSNLVKVLLDINENAIYFSRSVIPYPRNICKQYFGHIGLYGYSKKSLDEYCNLKPTELENIEKLEQLRAIYYGKKIAMSLVETKSFGIDTKEDLQKALNILQI